MLEVQCGLTVSAANAWFSSWRVTLSEAPGGAPSSARVGKNHAVPR
jgi:hypothetical protein